MQVKGYVWRETRRSGNPSQVFVEVVTGDGWTNVSPLSPRSGTTPVRAVLLVPAAVAHTRSAHGAAVGAVVHGQ
jgi:hypothetical protein